jgi:hypothetical protein
MRSLAEMRLMHFTAIVFMSISLMACSSKSLKDHHKEACSRQAKITIVNDNEFRLYLDIAFKKFGRSLPSGSRTLGAPQLLYEAPYSFRFGEELNEVRIVPSSQIVLENIYILKDEQVIAVLHDFVALDDVGDAKVGLSCLISYPEVFFLRRT